MKMNNKTAALEGFLKDLAAGARTGDRLPTVRELMRRFNLSQMSVQRVVHELKARGIIDSQVGRGTFFLAGGADVDGLAGAAPAGSSARASAVSLTSKSVLLLRRSFSISRGRVLIEKLHQCFAAGGHRVLEVSYSDPTHACAMLKGLPRFDACVIQSTYRAIPVEVLAAIHERADAIAVDGMALVGADIEAVGTEWGEPLAEASLDLYQRGHRELAFAATAYPLMATQLGFRRWEYMSNFLPKATLHTIKVSSLPDEDYLQCLVTELTTLRKGHGRLPFTALIVWGIEDGARFRQMVSDIGIAIPDDLSVVLLGRTDLSNECGEFFEVIGSRIDDQVSALYQAIVDRWANPARPYGLVLTPVRRLEGMSVAPLKGAKR